MSPRTFHALTRNPHPEVHFLRVSLYRILVVLLLRRIVIAVAELEEAQVRHLVVDVAADALQTAEQQRLSHDAEVRAERIHHLDGGLLGVLV